MPDNGTDTLVADALRKVGHRAPQAGMPMESVPKERETLGTQEALFRAAREVFAEHQLTPEEAKACAGHRTYDSLWAGPVKNRTEHADAETWKFQIAAQLAETIRQQTSTQMNGKWRLLRADIEAFEKVHTREVFDGEWDENSFSEMPKTKLLSERRTYFAIVFRLVDMNGNPDIEYWAGQPVRTPPARLGWDAEAMEAFLARFAGLPQAAQGGQAPLADPEKVELRNKLAALEAKVAALVNTKSAGRRDGGKTA